MLDADKIANPIHIGLRIGAQLIIQRDQDVFTAEAVEPLREMLGVAVAASQMRHGFEHLVKSPMTHPPVVTMKLEHGINSVDRIAHRRDDTAVRDEALDALGRKRREKVRADFDDRALAGCVAKMARVPINALVVEGVEELRL